MYKCTCTLCTCALFLPLPARLQVHLEFIQTCMQRLQIVFDGLQQFKPGEIEQEPPSVQQSFSTEVHTCVLCRGGCKSCTYILRIVKAGCHPVAIAQVVEH